MSPHSLEARLTTYLTLRKGLGMELGAESTVLADFVKFVGDQETTGPVMTEDGLRLARRHEGATTPPRRITAVERGEAVLAASQLCCPRHADSRSPARRQLPPSEALYLHA